MVCNDTIAFHHLSCTDVVCCTVLIKHEHASLHVLCKLHIASKAAKLVFLSQCTLQMRSRSVGVTACLVTTLLLLEQETRSVCHIVMHAATARPEKRIQQAACTTAGFVPDYHV